MSTTVHLELLSQVRIASPCPMRWEDMHGDDKTRHCDRCNLKVHNLTNMSETEVADLFALKLADPSRRVCGGLYKRADGTILTRDCPVGLSIIRTRMIKTWSHIAAAIGLLASAAYAAGLTSNPQWREWGWSIRLRNTRTVQWIRDTLHPPAPAVFYAGDMGISLPKSPPPFASSDRFPVGPHGLDDAQ